jgi:hypothetical protein
LVFVEFGSVYYLGGEIVLSRTGEIGKSFPDVSLVFVELFGDVYHFSIKNTI